MKYMAIIIGLFLVCVFLLFAGNAGLRTENRESSILFEPYASVIRGEVHSDAGYLYDSWLSGTSPVLMPAISNVEMTVKRTDGTEFSYDLSYITGSGIYFRPYAHLLWYIHARLGDEKLLNYDKSQIREVTGFDASPWGLPGKKVFQLTFESNIAYLPGARVPEMLVPSYNGGWRPAAVPPNSVPAKHIYHMNETAGNSVASVSVFYSEGMHLFREVVNLKSPNDGSLTASHCFDFLYEKNKAVNAKEPVLHYPSKVLLKIWLYDEGGHPAILFEKLPEKPAEYGITYEYFINSVNKPTVLGYTDWVADRVVIHEYPERLIPEGYGGGFGIKDESAPVEVTLTMTPTTDENDKLNTFRYLLSQF